MCISFQSTFFAEKYFTQLFDVRMQHLPQRPFLFSARGKGIRKVKADPIS